MRPRLTGKLAPNADEITSPLPLMPDFSILAVAQLLVAATLAPITIVSAQLMGSRPVKNQVKF